MNLDPIEEVFNFTSPGYVTPVGPFGISLDGSGTLAPPTQSGDPIGGWFNLQASGYSPPTGPLLFKILDLPDVPLTGTHSPPVGALSITVEDGLEIDLIKGWVYWIGAGTPPTYTPVAGLQTFELQLPFPAPRMGVSIHAVRYMDFMAVNGYVRGDVNKGVVVRLYDQDTFALLGEETTHDGTYGFEVPVDISKTYMTITHVLGEDSENAFIQSHIKPRLLNYG